MRVVDRAGLVAIIRDEALEAENANYHELCHGLNLLADAVENATEPVGYFAFVTFDSVVHEFEVH